MKLRRLMQIAPRGQILPKDSVVQHSKISRQMTLWVMCGRRLIGKNFLDVDAALVGCGHVSGLFVRR
jgi:hypothetical protein